MPLLNDITLGRYKDRTTFIHALDPRTKGLCVLSFMGATFWIDKFPSLTGGLVIALGLVILAKVGLEDLLRNLKGFVWLFILTFALHLIFTTGEEKVILPIVKLPIDITGLEQGVFYCLRIALLLAFSYLFMATTAPLAIADGLEKFLRVFKKLGLPAHESAMMFALALRFVPTLLDEARRIRDAQLCRGARLEGNLFFKVKGFSSMLIPLFASALRRADNLALALEARGYRGGEGRSYYIELKFRAQDLIALLVTSILILGLIIS
jgi:energy-coupling factor transport system permease protein